MNRFTHGIMVIDPLPSNDEGDVDVVHFVGYWSEPQIEDFLSLKNELRTDPDFGLVDIANRLVLLPATKEVIEHYNNQLIIDNIINLN